MPAAQRFRVLQTDRANGSIGEGRCPPPDPVQLENPLQAKSGSCVPDNQRPIVPTLLDMPGCCVRERRADTLALLLGLATAPPLKLAIVLPFLPFLHPSPPHLPGPLLWCAGGRFRSCRGSTSLQL